MAEVTPSSEQCTSKQREWQSGIMGLTAGEPDRGQVPKGRYTRTFSWMRIGPNCAVIDLRSH